MEPFGIRVIPDQHGVPANKPNDGSLYLGVEGEASPTPAHAAMLLRKALADVPRAVNDDVAAVSRAIESGIEPMEA